MTFTDVFAEVFNELASQPPRKKSRGESEDWSLNGQPRPVRGEQRWPGTGGLLQKLTHVIRHQQVTLVIIDRTTLVNSHQHLASLKNLLPNNLPRTNSFNIHTAQAHLSPPEYE